MNTAVVAVPAKPYFMASGHWRDTLVSIKTPNDYLRIAVTPEQAKPVIAELNRLHNALNEIHGWLVCGCIASPEDMAQSFERMTKVAGFGLGLTGEKP